ncbi:hypothetical protein N7478_005137 [Penicillium angulare]|uniref:uncharacterized protein n=1 Tax=Penicillium angulare TaxID=116970 RepID=UPI0025402C53|nr:uncharacterized protein N7478_005137 [Penicillium angulare]KAJ5279765.1 hypothetical protein N7478_005137 [Penicillium angulare]
MEDSLRSLRDACVNPDSFFATPQADLLRLVYKEFANEIDRLKRAYSIREGQISVSNETPSYVLYQSNYDEVNRTLVGFLSLRWIHLGQYESFVSSQPPEVKLTIESFTWIRDFYKAIIVEPDTLYALITSIITNDLGKDPQLAFDYYNVTGIDISDLNHDAILLKACQAGLIRSLDRLPIEYKNHLIGGIELGATFNFGQLAQAENVPACLSGLKRMKNNPICFQLRFMEQILDIAGAAGHMDSTCAKKLIQPIFESYRNVFDACQNLTAGSSNLRNAYDLILTRRANWLHECGFSFLDVNIADNRALLRLLCMGNVTTSERASLFEGTWNLIEEDTRESLIYALNLDGLSGEPAVQPTYVPALLSRIKEELPLTCALRYLSRVMDLSESVDPSVLVVERSLLGVIKNCVEGGQFNADPTILESLEVPEGVFALKE